MRPLPTLVAAMLCITAASPALAALRQVKGTLLFQDQTPDGAALGTKPIRNVSVSVKAGLNAVGSATTDSTGFFSAWIDDSKLSIGSPLYVVFESKNYASDVYLDLDWENDRLTWSKGLLVPSGTGSIDASHTVDVAAFSVHFSILDAIQWGRQYADARRQGSDDIGCVDVQYPDADWSNYQSYWEEITLSGHEAYGYGSSADEHGWQDGTVLHEYGHHLEYEISDVDGGGGKHSVCSDFGNEFAWKEGWPTYFAEAVRLEYPAKVVEGGWNLEDTPACASSSTEAFAWATLMDLHDGLGSNADAHDRVDGGMTVNGRNIRDVLFFIFDKEQDDWISESYDPKTNILSFHNHLVARDLYVGSHADVDRIYQRHGIPVHSFANYTVSSLTKNVGNIMAGKTVNLTMALSNTGVTYADELVTVRVYIPGQGKGSLVLDTFTTSNFLGSKTLTRTVTMPATLAQGTYSVAVQVDATDRFPETVESDNTLSLAVPVVVCGNGTCSSGESCSTCPSDCGSCCGNGVCANSETCDSCPGDCGACTGCGDGFCVGDELASCAIDCDSVEPGGTCFVAGTLISLADGSTKPIERIAAGDVVLSYDTERGAVVPGEVVRTFVHPDSDRLVVVNDTLVTTAMHRFFVDGEWVRADALEPGSPLLAAPAETAGAGSTRSDSVRQVQALPDRATTYNFEVARFHNYFAGNVLVHNIKK